MVDMTTALLEQAAAAAEHFDMTQEHAGFEREIIPEGRHQARFVGYVEIGKRKATYQGKEKNPEPKAMLFYELVSRKLGKEIEVNGVKKTIYPIHRETIGIKSGAKSNAFKLMSKMTGGDKNVKHIAQLLGQAFLVKVVHSEPDEKGKIWVNIKADGEWLVTPPVITATNEDGDLVEQRINIAPATVPLRLLLWNTPTKEQWDSLFIEGSYEKEEEDGTKTTVSKNWLQRACTEAIDFEGSPLQNMLGGLDDLTLSSEIDTLDEKSDEPGEPLSEPDTGDDLPVDDDEAEIAKAAAEAAAAARAAIRAKAAEKVKAASKHATKNTPVSHKEEKPVDPDEDPLKALGL